MTDEEKLERYEKMNKGVKPKFHKGKHINDWWICGNCGVKTYDTIGDNYCRNCGYRIKWDSIRCLTEKRRVKQNDIR